MALSWSNWVFLGTAIVLKIWEVLFPLRTLPPSHNWILRAAALTLFQLLVAYTGIYLLPEDAEGLLPLGATLGAWQGAGAVALISFISYWQHRFKHRFVLLWNWLHQVHHSPVRIELLTSFYRSPLEILVNLVFMYLIMFRLLGFGLEAVLNCTLFLALADLFYHANIRTPRILGYIIQRPESHLLHHMRGIQAFNYGDLPVWDILFGTFRNMRSRPRLYGFAGGREERLCALIAGEPDREKRIASH